MFFRGTSVEDICFPTKNIQAGVWRIVVIFVVRGRSSIVGDGDVCSSRGVRMFTTTNFELSDGGGEGSPPKGNSVLFIERVY